MTREEAKKVFLNRGFIDGIYNGDKWREACIVISKWLEQEPIAKNDLSSGLEKNSKKLENPTTKNDLSLIHTEGLDEEIRCTMCTNSMKSDRGCDGSCVVNKDMYKAVIDTIERRIQPTTKNDLGVDCISREQARNAIISHQYSNRFCEEHNIDHSINTSMALIALWDLPSVTPQEPQSFKWCTDCKEYDQEKHCCHRWSKVIRDTVEEMKQEQEPVLDKIRAEIEETYMNITYQENKDRKATWGLRKALQIIDKYKAE